MLDYNISDKAFSGMLSPWEIMFKSIIGSSFNGKLLCDFNSLVFKLLNVNWLQIANYNR